MTETPARVTGIIAAIAIPLVALVVVTAGILLLGLVGANPFWSVVPVSLPEAAASRDRGELVRLLEAGGDPAARAPVRAGMLDERALELTPAEAAVMADRAEMLRILFAHGLAADAEAVGNWLCLATRVGAREAPAYLRERFPDWSAPTCAVQ